jgi:hypothetical protein
MIENLTYEIFQRGVKRFKQDGTAVQTVMSKTYFDTENK